MTAVATLIDRYALGPAILEYAVYGLSDEHLRARPGPGAWSIAELVAHLADSDVVASDRMKRVLAEPEPVLLAYDENAWNDRLRMQEAPVDLAVALFAANRRWTARILRDAAEADFARAGVHSEKGRTTLAELVVSYVGHIDHHLKYLYAKRANLGVAIQPRYTYPIV
ncbi:DinB family protein [Planctomyces sp. SH-PL62]|uniref:DinB family protein n=1 Tax=Planctomyces sp. SH-PL62 TaxID=1636152 RepID=UPI00078E1079|nr:DinB family protein [Planctomyces sp. SH-PL62]AMV38664.1 Putative metal-dependent hydrolase YfiT [Planctomyces sp. SH-PL62]